MLANLVSGIIVALAQPVRIGDYVAIDEWQGTIEEVRLTYSYIVADDNSRIVIPNEQLGSKVIRNFTIVDETSAASVEFVVPAATALADVRREALAVAAGFSRGRSPDRQPALAVTELGADVVHLRLTVWQESKADADRAAAGLRFALEERLRAAGLDAGKGLERRRRGSTLTRRPRRPAREILGGVLSGRRLSHGRAHGLIPAHRSRGVPRTRARGPRSWRPRPRPSPRRATCGAPW